MHKLEYMKESKKLEDIDDDYLEELEGKDEKIWNVLVFEDELRILLRKGMNSNILLLISAIFYILCCITRIAGSNDLVAYTLTGGYVYFKWIAVVTFVLWSAVRIVKKTMSMNKNIWKRIATVLLFTSLYFAIFMIARSVLLYFQFAAYGGGWSHPSLIGNILLSNLFYGGTGIPFTYGVMFLLVLAVSSVVAAVASALRKKD